MYVYRLASAHLTLYDYVAIMHTADGSVDLTDVPALWTHYPMGRDTELARLDENVSAAKTLTAAYDAAKTSGGGWRSDGPHVRRAYHAHRSHLGGVDRRTDHRRQRGRALWTA